jgi:KipI family sensor histidine kinase inhibitor
MSGPGLAITPLGDQALLVTCASPLALAAALERAELAGLLDLVPAKQTLLVIFDPDQTSATRLRRHIRSLAISPTTERPAREHVIPLSYDGPDLAEVAERCGLTAAELIARHSGAVYRVALIGFLPGFPYLDGLPPELHLPRRATPRPRVPAGSVAIAGPQTGIYPQSSPGGWHLLGTTAVRLFDPARWPPALLSAGDIVRFVPADREDDF